MVTVSAFRAVADRIAGGLQVLSEVALVVLLGLVAHEVFVRYALNAPTQYSVEFSEYLLVLGPFASLAYVLRRDRHVRVSLAISIMPPRPRLVCAVISNALLAAFCAMLFWYGADMAWTAFLGDDRSSSLIAFPLWIPYSFIPVGALVCGLQCLVLSAEAVQALRGSATITDSD